MRPCASAFAAKRSIRSVHEFQRPGQHLALSRVVCLRLLAGAQSLRAGRQDACRLPARAQGCHLRDLNFEYQAGKYPEAEYVEQRRALEDEAAQVIAEMEGLTARGMKAGRFRA
jgi:hypothetical protein